MSGEHLVLFDSLESCIASDVSGPSKRRWQCSKCEKLLSSKRSYDEHMNVHNNLRPFQCEDCEFAAASHMTLRRHRQRNHMSRKDWGYKCPYCPESFVEPASYQDHVRSRHAGRSCTFGCPVCEWRCRCARFFKEHIQKHIYAKMWHARDLEDLNEYELHRFLIDDENGRGFRFLSKETPENPICSRRAPSLLSQRQNPDFFKEPLRCPPSSAADDELLRAPFQRQEIVRKVPVIPRRIAPMPDLQEPHIMPADSDWIEAEIVVGSASNPFPDGLVDTDLD